MQPTQFILYLTRDTAPTLDSFPAIVRHLERFRPILERRREVQKNRIAWFHLHWPREEAIFTRPRIISVQMGRTPQFVFTESPAFVGFSINLILSPGNDVVRLQALTGILNSSLAGSWFARHAKRRGINLEINAHVLRDFPVANLDSEAAQLLADIVGKRHRAPPHLASNLELEIESAVRALYTGERPL